MFMMCRKETFLHPMKVTDGKTGLSSFLFKSLLKDCTFNVTLPDVLFCAFRVTFSQMMDIPLYG